MNLKPALSVFMILALVSPGSAAAPAMTRIGVAGAVQGAVKAFAPGPKPVGRVVQSGKDLYLNDKITTDAKGSLQVMLLDETVFTIGPNSSMELDEFVYDPSSGAGKVTARVTKGVFRFVTGKIGHANPSDMKVKFPAGTMGVRGTIVAGRVDESGATTAVLLGPGARHNVPGERVGAFNLENAGASVDVLKPGYGSTIGGADKPPTPPIFIPQAQLNTILGELAHAPNYSAEEGDDQGKPRTRSERRDGKPDFARKEGNEADNEEGGDDQGKPRARSERRDGKPDFARKEGNQADGEGDETGPKPEPRNGPPPVGEKFIGPDGQEYQVADTQGGEYKFVAPDGQEVSIPKAEADRYFADPEGFHLGPEGDRYSATDLAGQDIYGAYGDLTTVEYTHDLGAYADNQTTFASLDSNDLQVLGAYYGASKWDELRVLKSGTGVFPAVSGQFFLEMCKGGACVNPTGTWGFNMTVDFGAQTINGTANIMATAGGVTIINESLNISRSYAADPGFAVFQENTGNANYVFGFGNHEGIIAKGVHGEVHYFDPAQGGTKGAGQGLDSIREGGTQTIPQ